LLWIQRLSPSASPYGDESGLTTPYYSYTGSTPYY
jgi:hypothetical protein